MLYVKSIASFNTLTRINDQLSITNKLSYQSSLVLSSFYFYAIFRNGDEYLIRNERAIRQLDKNLNTFGNVNQEILTVIFDAKSHSKNDLVLQDFLQTNLCRHIKSDLRATCNSITQGDRLGLLGFNTRYYKESENYISLLKRAAQNEDFVRTLASLYLEEVTQDVAILDASYNFLTLYILEGFRDQAASLETLNLLLSLAAITFIVLTTIVIQTVTLNKLIYLDNSQKKLFRSLTYHVFSQNKAVGFLLKKEFGEEVEGLNRVLYGN